MMQVVIEMFPGGDKKRRKLLGVMWATNTGGDKDHGNYDVRIDVETQNIPRYKKKVCNVSRKSCYHTLLGCLKGMLE